MEPYATQIFNSSGMITVIKGLRLFAYWIRDSAPLRRSSCSLEGISDDAQQLLLMVNLPTPANAKFFTISAASGLFEPVTNTCEDDNSCWADFPYTNICLEYNCSSIWAGGLSIAELNRLASARLCRAAKYTRQQKMLKRRFIISTAGTLLDWRGFDQEGVMAMISVHWKLLSLFVRHVVLFKRALLSLALAP